MQTTLTAITDRNKLKRAVAELTKLPKGKAPSRELLTDFLDGWGPDPLAPDVNFLEGVGRGACSCGRTILECGAGPTTVLLAALAGRRGVKVCAMEGATPARERVTRIAEDLGLSIEFVDGSPTNFGSFIWFDPPFNRLPERLWPSSAQPASRAVAR